VSDGTTTSASATVSITVLNAGPVANDDVINLSWGAWIVITPQDNDTDANGDPLVITAITAAKYAPVSFTPEAIRYDGRGGFVGTDTFTYTISDGAGGTSTATVTINIGNGAPVAVDDEATTLHDVPVTIDVLTNDSDPDTGDVLSVASVGDPAHGSAVVLSDQVVYTPNAGFVGDDTFTYVITDFAGVSAVATVTVHVTNTAPVAVDDSATTVHGTSTTVDVVGNDSDADGDGW